MHDDFSADGFLARTIPGFQPREAQVTMSNAVTESIEQQHVLVAEAGTGTGKTYAYLVPALRSGKKSLFLRDQKPYKINCITETYRQLLMR